MDERSGQEWLDARFNSITGTDVAKIMGCDDKVSTQKLLTSKLFKLDLMAKASDITKDLLTMGTIFEEAALSAFKLSQISIDGYVPGLSPHPFHSWFCGTPDFIGLAEDGSHVVVEVKTHFYPSLSEAVPFPQVEAIPLKHWIQVQSYLEILDLNVGYLWSWTLYQGATCFRILRDKEWWDNRVFPRISKFWDLMCLFKDMSTLEDVDKICCSLRWQKGEKMKITDEARERLFETTFQIYNPLVL